MIIWKEYQVNDWKKYKEFTHHQNSVNACSFAPGEFGLRLATCSTDGTISVIQKNSTDEWELLTKTQAHEMGINSIVWGPRLLSNQKVV